jgi:hypothetical protein
VVWGVSASVLALGCSLPTSAIAPSQDTGVMTLADLGALDAGPRIDAWSSIDTGQPNDAWTPPANDAWSAPGNDAYVPTNDAYVPPPNDAYVPPPNDAYVPTDAYRAPDAYQTCAAIYGGVSGYSAACPDSGSNCVFVVHLTGGASCDSTCNMGHGGCVSQDPNGASTTSCTGSGDEGCGMTHTDRWRICTCAH